MSLETPRSSAGLSTPRTFQEIFNDHDIIQDFDDFVDYDFYTSDEENPSSSNSSCESQTIYDDTNLNVISNVVNVCSDCSKCEKEAIYKLSILETKFTEETLARHRQLQLLLEFEKRTRDWISEKNAIIEKLEIEKSNAENDRNVLQETLNTISMHLFNLENSFNDVHEKYEKAKNTIEILTGNVETLKNSLQEYENCMKQKQEQFEKLKDHAIDRLNQANVHLDLVEKNFFAKCSLVHANENLNNTKVQELNEKLKQKNRENAELISICEFLLQTFKESKSDFLNKLILDSVTMWLNDLHDNINEN